MNSDLVLRGRIYAVRAHGQERYCLVISNNQRNQRFPDVLAVWLTAVDGPVTASAVALPPGEPLVGRALCDAIEAVVTKRIARDLGAVSPRTMRRVGDGLRAALGL
ncbi:MAG: type II toxin-antitoxin system PemK/MazF family toxin [Mycobacteriales bacterium]